MFVSECAGFCAAAGLNGIFPPFRSTHLLEITSLPVMTLLRATTQEWLIRSLNDYSHSLWWLRFLLLRVMKLSCTEEIAGICGSEVNVLSNCKYQVSWSAAQHLEGELLAPGIRTHHYCGFTFLETVVITYQCKLNSLFWRSCAFESYFILQQTDTNNSV